MSWELMSEHKEPCKCGKGVVVTGFYMDDWNRSETRIISGCKECSAKEGDKATEQ